jgi:hypothetical protein
MNVLAFAFSSPYDQASLAVTALALVMNLIADRVRPRPG